MRDKFDYDNLALSNVVSSILIVGITVALVALVTFSVFTIQDNSISDPSTSNGVVDITSTNGNVTVNVIRMGDTEEYRVETVDDTYTLNQSGESITVDSYGGDVDVISKSGGSEQLVQKYDGDNSDEDVRVVSSSLATYNYANIESADSEAVSGDTILVKSGTYSSPKTVNATIETDEVEVLFEDGVKLDCALAGTNVGLQIQGNGVTVTGGSLGSYFQNCASSMNISSDNVTLNQVATEDNIISSGENLDINEDNKDPISDITITSSSTVNTGESISLSASDSSDPDDTITAYDWDIDSDGNYEKSGETITASYGDDGSYSPNLRVTDEFGQTSVDSVTVTVLNQAPSTIINLGTSEANLGDSVSFDGSSSSDTDGSITSYSWNLDDGTTKTGSSITHTYSTTGTYIIELIVTDDDGDTASETAEIDIINQDPTASISAGSQTIDTGSSVSLDGSGSSDPEGSISSYSWDLGDGTTKSGESISHSYSSAGSYTVTLTVTDSGGATDTDTITIDVQNPVNAEASYLQPDVIKQGDNIELDGSGSSSPNGIVEYEWDATNANANKGDYTDGLFGETVTTSTSRTGRHSVRLIVTDSTGATDDTPSLTYYVAHSKSATVTIDNTDGPFLFISDNVVDQNGDPIPSGTTVNLYEDGVKISDTTVENDGQFGLNSVETALQMNEFDTVTDERYYSIGVNGNRVSVNDITFDSSGPSRDYSGIDYLTYEQDLVFNNIDW